jgi:hypothetical protein
MNTYKEEAEKVAKMQREAGWDEKDIAAYAKFQYDLLVSCGWIDEDGNLPHDMHLGASL